MREEGGTNVKICFSLLKCRVETDGNKDVALSIKKSILDVFAFPQKKFQRFTENGKLSPLFTAYSKHVNLVKLVFTVKGKSTVGATSCQA